MKPEVSEQEKINRKKRWRYIGILTAFEVLLLAWVLYCLYGAVNYKVSDKEELVCVTGIVEEYKHIHRHHDSEYRICLTNGETYYISSPSLPAFKRSNFERYVHKGDEITLWIDPNEHSSYKPYVAEIWNEGICYMAYENYAKENEINASRLQIFFIVYPIGFLLACIYINEKLWDRMKEKQRTIFYIEWRGF